LAERRAPPERGHGVSEPKRDIVVIGASAGGVEALTRVVRGLPADLPAAVFVVLHIAEGPSVLPNILSRAGGLPAAHPRHQDPIMRGRIYVAPPDQHLLIVDGTVHLARGPRENGHRPAVDPLFRTAARIYGPRVVGVVLSGSLDDGTAGLVAIKRRGGVAVVQDPDEALFKGMPRSAVDNVAVDHVLALDEIPPKLVHLVGKPPVGAGEPIWTEMEMEARMAELDEDAVQSEDQPGTPSAFGCPECGGVLWELRDGELIRFRCRVGHAYSPDTLSNKQVVVPEDALWVALRALEEQAALAQRLAQRADQRGQRRAAERFLDRRREAHSQAEVIREVLANGRPQERVPQPPES
jgi:two-component system chemotaxis response regulator CheB